MPTECRLKLPALRNVAYELDVGASSRFLLISQQVVTFSRMRNVHKFNYEMSRAIQALTAFRALWRTKIVYAI